MDVALPGGLALRPVTGDDEELLLALHVSTMPSALVEAGLAPMQHDARQRSLAAAWPDARDHVVLTGGEAVGRLWLAEDDAAIRVLDVALLPEHRGRGIGGALLASLTARCDARGVPLRLAVAHDEPDARRLYERHGLVEVSRDAVRAELERVAGA